MKKSLTILLLTFTTLISFSQSVPKGINYQAIARDASTGQVLSGKTISVSFKIYNSIGSSSFYQESHALTTTNLGYFNVVIGQGTPSGSSPVASFSAITFSTGTVAYEVFIDGVLLGSKTTFMSTPYALYAESSGSSSSPATVNLTGLGSTSVSGTSPNFTISTPSPSLSISSGSIILTPGNGVLLPAASSAVIMGGGITSVIGPPSNYTVTTPSPTLAVISGSLLSISGGNTVTIPGASTPTITGATPNITVTTGPPNSFTVGLVPPSLSVVGGTISGSYPSQTITIPPVSSTPTITGATPNITVTTGPPNSFTVSAITPTLSVVGGTISGSYPSQTITIPSASSATITPGSNVNVVTGLPNTFTVSATTPSLSVVGGNIIGTYPTQTLTVDSPTLNFVAGTPNNTLTVGGSTLIIPAKGTNSGSLGAVPVWTTGIDLIPSVISQTSSGQIQVTGVSGVQPSVQIKQGTGVNYGLEVTDNSGLNSKLVFGSGGLESFLGTSTNTDLKLFTNNTIGSQFVMDKTGIVGIGCAPVPGYTLATGGPVNFQSYLNMIGSPVDPPLSSAGQGRIYLSTNPVKGFMASINGSTYQSLFAWGIYGNDLFAASIPGLPMMGSTSNHPVPFQSNGFERMRLTETGLFGIGLAIPSALLHVEKSITTSPIAKFVNTNSANPNDGVISDYNGRTAAIRAISGPTTALTQNIAVAIDGGHLSSKINAPTVLGGGSILILNGNDAAGFLKIKSGGGYSILSSTTETITVSFNKPYNTGKLPVVVVTPNFQLPDKATYWIETIDTSTFRIYVYNNSGSSINFIADQLIFTYMVMGLHP